MDFKVQLRTIELMNHLVNSYDREKVSHVVYSPQKVKFNPEAITSTHLPESTPEAEGIPSAYLEQFFKELAVPGKVDAHSVIIVRHGKVIAKGSFVPYREDYWHITHSLCKSITGTAIGLAVDEGILNLDERLVDIFKKKAGLWAILTQRDLTVRHLLTMSSGVLFNELGAVTVNDWVKEYMTSKPQFAPGEKFAYNSMNTYMLSAIIHEKTGMDMMDFLKPRLLDPMGITDIYWEKCPNGISKGGWGLNILIEDMAKLGQLYLQEGVWNGRRLLSEEWIREATRKQIETLEVVDTFGYGYQIWMGKCPGSFNFNGMLGQNVFVFPDRDLVVAITAGSANLFQPCLAVDLIMKYFGQPEWTFGDTLPEDAVALKRFHHTLKQLKFHKHFKPEKGPQKLCGGWKRPKNNQGILASKKAAGTLPTQALELHNKIYKLQDNAAGLMPLFIQSMHTNFSPGTEEIRFEIESGVLVMYSIGKSQKNEEGVDTTIIHRVPIGFDKPVYTDIEQNGEVYTISAMGAFTVNEDDYMVLKLMVSFIETSNTRSMKLFFSGNRICIQYNELPALSEIMDGVISMITAGKPEVVANSIMGVKDTELTHHRIAQAIAPEVYGDLVTSEDNE